MLADNIVVPLLTTPPVNDEIARDPEQIAPPLFLVCIRSSTQQPAKSLLDYVLGVGRIARHPVDV
jgi:hypothetical protein